MKIALYYRHIDPADRQAFDTLVGALADRRVETVTLRDGDSVDGCQFLLSIGGDGTLLSSVQFVRSSNPANFPPILGINFGHLGFLTTVGKENLCATVDDLLAGRYSIEERSLLQVERDGAPSAYALNEVFVHRGDSMSLLRTQVFVDDLYVATYSGDGVIIATPTGSTAYSLSAGGPIIEPTVDVISLTPVSPHSLHCRPYIFAADTVFEVTSRKREDGENVYFSCDGGESLLLPPGGCVRITRAETDALFVSVKPDNFIDVLNQKLEIKK